MPPPPPPSLPAPSSNVPQPVNFQRPPPGQPQVIKKNNINKSVVDCLEDIQEALNEKLKPVSINSKKMKKNKFAIVIQQPQAVITEDDDMHDKTRKRTVKLFETDDLDEA